MSVTLLADKDRIFSIHHLVFTAYCSPCLDISRRNKITSRKLDFQEAFGHTRTEKSPRSSISMSGIFFQFWTVIFLIHDVNMCLRRVIFFDRIISIFRVFQKEYQREIS